MLKSEVVVNRGERALDNSTRDPKTEMIHKECFYCDWKGLSVRGLSRCPRCNNYLFVPSSKKESEEEDPNGGKMSGHWRVISS